MKIKMTRNRIDEILKTHNLYIFKEEQKGCANHIELETGPIIIHYNTGTVVISGQNQESIRSFFGFKD